MQYNEQQLDLMTGETTYQPLTLTCDCGRKHQLHSYIYATTEAAEQAVNAAPIEQPRLIDVPIESKPLSNSAKALLRKLPKLDKRGDVLAAELMQYPELSQEFGNFGQSIWKCVAVVQNGTYVEIKVDPSQLSAAVASAAYRAAGDTFEDVDPYWFTRIGGRDWRSTAYDLTQGVVQHWADSALAARRGQTLREQIELYNYVRSTLYAFFSTAIPDRKSQDNGQ